MFEEYEKRKRKQVAQMKSLMDYGMGLLILLVGLFFLFRSRLGNIPLNEKLGEPDTLEKIFGGLCLIYGAWRIYRGYKKKYFR
jgi:threonine/homoserine/homoserine lactone efflux protein